MKYVSMFFGFILCCSVLFSCGNEPDEDCGQKMAQNLSNAATVQFSLETGSRTVLPQTVNPADLTDFNLQGIRTGSGNGSGSGTIGYVQWDKTYATYSDFLQASITLETGEWTFSLSAKKGGTTYSATTAVEIVYGSNLIHFYLTLADKGSGQGGFSLSLDFSGAEHAAEVTRAACAIQNMDGTSVRGFPRQTVSVSGGALVYSQTSVPAGNYRVLITLYAGNLELSTWREIVVVSSDLESSASRTIDLLNLYQITYVLNDDEESRASFTGTAAETYTRFSSDVTLPALTRPYYDFEGWYENSDFSGEPVAVIDTSRAEDVALYAKWTSLRTTYKVEHYKQNISDDGYILVDVDTEIINGIAGELTDCAAKEYEGFTVLEFEQKSIEKNKGTVLKIYYDRDIVINF